MTREVYCWWMSRTNTVVDTSAWVEFLCSPAPRCSPPPPADYDAAAALYRTCRTQGATVRRMIDCLIAAVAIAADAEVLHADSDFDELAAHTPLRIHRLSL